MHIECWGVGREVVWKAYLVIRHDENDVGLGVCRVGVVVAGIVQVCARGLRLRDLGTEEEGEEGEEEEEAWRPHQ